MIGVTLSVGVRYLLGKDSRYSDAVASKDLVNLKDICYTVIVMYLTRLNIQFSSCVSLVPKGYRLKS